jgi:hypothetical protein
MRALPTRDKYRIDYLTRSARNRAKTIACDGEHRWVVFAAQMTVGPAYSLSRDIANVVDSSWLLRCRLSGGAEISYRGRRAYQLRASRDGDGWHPAPLPSFPADAIVDAELGCLLRLISFAGDRPASWYELSGIGIEPVPPGEFRLDIPPGVRVVEATGNPFTDSAAVCRARAEPWYAPPPTSSAGRATRSPPPGASWMTCAAGAVVKTTTSSSARTPRSGLARHGRAWAFPDL